MNEFDHRWQACAARARQVPGGPVDVPPGFATRVWARWTSQSSPAPAAVWLGLSLRALMVATVVLAVCAAMELGNTGGEGSFVPHVEDVVTRMLWTL
jgi:hypothetical protein